MKELDNYLNTFQIIIDDLIDASPAKNVRLGGSLILKLHGLNFSRSIGDLDIIITNPTNKQKDYLKALRFFNHEDEGYNGNNETNYKFKKHTLSLNVLVTDKYSKDIVQTYYLFNNKYYGFVPVQEIIDAKKTYGRKKDINDFLILKNENFNM